MAKITKFHTSDFKKETGASMVEYALTIALLALVLVGGFRAVGVAASTTFNRATDGVEGCTAGRDEGGACLSESGY